MYRKQPQDNTFQKFFIILVVVCFSAAFGLCLEQHYLSTQKHIIVQLFDNRTGLLAQSIQTTMDHVREDGVSIQIDNTVYNNNYRIIADPNFQ